MIAALPFEIQRYEGAGRDAHGNERETWAPAVPELAYGFYTRVSDEPRPDRDVVTERWSLLAPASVSVGPHDRVTVLGETYEVVGIPRVWNHGPFGWAAGVEIVLRREGG